MKNYTKIDKKKALEIIKKWLEQIIVGWNICPFAKEPFLNNRIRYAITYHKPNLNYFQEFLNEIQFLNSHNQIDTTLWILPDFLNDLPQLYHLITTLDQFLFESKNYKSYQIVFFHPDANIKDIDPTSPRQLVIKAPLPIIHILRTPQIENLGAKIKNDVHITNDKRLSLISDEEYQEIWKNIFKIH